MKISYLHIVLLLLASTTQAQSLTEYYKSLHGTTDGCKSFAGVLDETFDLELLICGDKGVYKMNSSSDIYNLNIETKGDQMEIIEEDSQGRTSGYITLTKSVKGYEGEWRQIESASRYSFELLERYEIESQKAYYLTRLSGIIRGRQVHITIDHSNESIEIEELHGLQGRYKSNYTCQNKNCHKLTIKPIGIIGVNTIEVYKDKRGKYKLIVLTADQNREASELQIVHQVQKKTKAYSDYRSMIVAEYASFNNKDLDNYLNKMQANWIKSTSIQLRELHKEDPIEIVSDRFKHQANSWIDVELWTEDFLSGVQYKQYNWKSEVEVTAFAYYIDKSKSVSLNSVWKDNWSNDKLVSKIDNENSTWVVNRSGIDKVYFDRVTGTQRETFLYSDLKENIDKRSWLNKLLDEGKIKN